MIWNKEFTIEELTSFNNKTKNPFNIEFVEIGDDFLSAKMPVDDNSKQPMGLLHGGASVFLAETLGSIAGNFCIKGERKAVVGLEINANHLRGVRDGFVYGTARPIHIGGKTQVWSIEILNEEGKKVCVSRLTLAVISI